MKIVIFLIIASLTVAITFLVAFVWAVKNNQFDDTVTPSHRILFDDFSKRKQDTQSNKG